MGSKRLRIWFDKIIKIYDGIRYLVLLGHSWYDEICDSIKYLIGEKIGITDSINHNFARIRIDSNNSSPIEKILTFHVIMLIQLLIKSKISTTIIYF